MIRPDCEAHQSQTTTAGVIYLFGFLRGSAAGNLPGLESLTVGTIAAIYEWVPAADWDPSTIEANLHDNNWLVPRVWHHSQTIDALNARSVVLPVRFGAVFSTEEALAELMAGCSAQIAQFLDRTTGHDEWSLKSFLEIERARASLLATDPQLSARHRALSLNPGKRYFQEKLLNSTADRLALEIGHGALARIHDFLKPLVVESRPLRLHPPAGSIGPMLGHAAFLVSRQNAEAFCERVKGLQADHSDQGLVLECTGPWPPYSFAPVLTGPTS